MNKYCEWSSTLRVASVSKHFLVLKEIGYLYLSENAEEIKKMIQENPLYQQSFRIEEMYELLGARTDYKKISKKIESRECCIQ